MTAAEYQKQGDGELIQITCGACHQPSGYSRWCCTDVFGDLPDNEYQCPKCGLAFRRERFEGDPWRCINGEWKHQEIDLTPIPTRL